MKYVLTLFAILLILEPKVYAKDDKWIDGIRFTFGEGRQYIRIGTTSKDSRKNKLLIETSDPLSQGNIPLFPLTITFPESLMTSWSFRGAFFQYNNAANISDLAPSGDHSEETYWRQNNDGKNYLVNDFFTDEDKDLYKWLDH